MEKIISIEDALKLTNVRIVDVRSEAEFAEGSIPGAVNIPLFNNEERAQVGTTYKQIGTEEAKYLGLEIAGPKLSALYNKISSLGQDKDIVLYCWRGGMRSKYTTSILNMLGLKAARIQGGYKAYRRLINRYLDKPSIPHKSIVLHGLTGVGKTLILKKLQHLGLPVLDLEGIARHRGSAYGKIGLPASPSQKDFEANIVEILSGAERKGIILVECESRRVGKLIVPPAVMDSMTKGYRILLYASMQKRVERIIEDYTSGPDSNIESLQYSTSLLKKSLGNKMVEELNQKIAEKRFTEVIPHLLVHYYDPLYKYPDEPSDNYNLSVNCDDLDRATATINEWIRLLPEYGKPVDNGGEDDANRGNSEECADEERVYF
ncbi:tRNA 2-selenouridine(34) synthase MnmH [Desulforamulus aeronauticus]|uniref:tRNA 2-selenouridine synthase n=1 Tax=Desulforamulus aeronauticus DSM 10349 TaxID=1121421 RepID=A0A1M6U5Q8_9FIRM|nr:tRNA 2-selenouridine(34) synthase MnmH [Desulforamulus aeronauticus]SHK64513.1 tRNA 2-selenouridine synthase [Desulforamulus aeronauticus DSM 10349]